MDSEYKGEVDFFISECQTENIRNARFGICDGSDGDKAYVSYDNPQDWVAIVENPNSRSLNFTAIDNCVEILRDNGETANRCDGMLTGEGYLIFIELKDQRSDWIHHAVTHQLQSTIDVFSQNYDITAYPRRYAYVCNKRHPAFQYSHKELMNEFMRRNKIRLCIVNRITIK